MLQEQAEGSEKINWEIPDRRWQCRSCSSTCSRRNSERVRPKQWVISDRTGSTTWSSRLVQRWLRYENSLALWWQWTTDDLLGARGSTEWGCTLWVVDGARLCQTSRTWTTPLYDHSTLAAIKAIAVAKLDFIYANGRFGIRPPAKSMNIEEVSLTKLFTVCGTWLSDVLTV